jgi:hypothetical protein
MCSLNLFAVSSVILVVYGQRPQAEPEARRGES